MKPGSHLKMKIFCTGVTGFIGYPVLARLLGRGHTAYILYRSKATFGSELNELLQKYENQVQLIQGDVTKPDTLKVPADTEACIYMACNSRWGTLETQSTLDIAVNGTKYTLEAVGPDRRFVYVSSAAAMLLDEDFNSRQTLDMSNYDKTKFVYSCAKHGAEDNVKGASNNYVIVRPGEVYDADDKKMITAQNVKDYMDMPAFTLEGGVSLASRQEIASAIVSAVETPQRNKTYGLGGPNVTISELARHIQLIHGQGRLLIQFGYDFAFAAVRFFKKFGIKIMEEEAVKYAGFNWFMDSSNAVRDLGYHMLTPEEVLTPVVRWLEEQAQKPKKK